MNMDGKVEIKGKTCLKVIHLWEIDGEPIQYLINILKDIEKDYQGKFSKISIDICDESEWDSNKWPMIDIWGEY